MIYKISRKILLIGIIFLLSSTCLSNVAAQNNTSYYLTMEEQHSNLQGLEFREEPRINTLESPISDESNDDFDLNVPPIDQFKKESDFDIPVVINDKVERFIHLFQTTIRHKFVTWLDSRFLYHLFLGHF